MLEAQRVPVGRGQLDVHLEQAIGVEDGFGWIANVGIGASIVALAAAATDAHHDGAKQRRRRDESFHCRQYPP